MQLDPLQLLADYEAAHPPVASAALEPDPGEGQALRKFLAETGHTLPEIAAAVNAYLRGIPNAIEGEHGGDIAFNVAKVIRHDFDLGEHGWETFREWNRLKCDPPFDEEAEGGKDSLRRKFRDAGQLTRPTKPRGHMLWSSDVLRWTREQRAMHGPPANDDGWELGAVPLSQFLAARYPKPEQIVGPFDKGALCFIYGAAGSLKTWLALEVMKQAAEAGHTSVYVLEEGMPFRMQHRFGNLRVNPERVHIALRKRFDLKMPSRVKALIEYAKSVRASLIVLDPFSDCSSADENDRGEMLVVRQALDKLVQETGACVLVVHHSNKAGGRQGKADLGADMANMRGSSVLMGAVDLMLEVRRAKGHGSAAAEVTMTKNRNGSMEFPGRVELFFDDEGRVFKVEWTHGEQAKLLAEAKMVKKELEEADREVANRALDQALYEAAAAQPGLSKSRLAKEVLSGTDKSQRTVEGRVDALLASGHLRNRGSKAAWELEPGKPLGGVRGGAREAVGQPNPNS